MCICFVNADNSDCCNVPVPAHQPPSLPTCKPVLSPAMERSVSASVPCHGWTPPCYPPGNPRQYPGEMAGGGEPCVDGPAGSCPAANPVSPYPSPPLSTHGRPTSGADLRWSPVSQLGADDSWSCSDLSTRNQLRSPLPIDFVGSSEVMSDDFDLGLQNTGRQSTLTAYTGTRSYMFVLLQWERV